MNIKQVGIKALSSFKSFSSEHSPEMLLITGLVTLGLSQISTVFATKNAIESIENEKHRVGKMRLDKKEVVKVTWRHCIIPVSTFVAGTGCIIQGNSISSQRTAALATALGVSQGMLSDYKKATIEQIGHEKENEITKKLAQQKVDSIESDSDITQTSGGDVLFYDSVTGHLITSSKVAIREALNRINERMFDEVYIEYSEFCYEIGYDGGYLAATNGWNIEDGIIKLSELNEAGVTADGKPYIILDFLIKPSGNYRRR